MQDNIPFTGSLAGNHSDVVKILPKSDGSIKFVLKNYQTDEDGDTINESLETVVLTNSDDISGYSEAVQKTCRETWDLESN